MDRWMKGCCFSTLQTLSYKRDKYTSQIICPIKWLLRGRRLSCWSLHLSSNGFSLCAVLNQRTGGHLLIHCIWSTLASPVTVVSNQVFFHFQEGLSSLQIFWYFYESPLLWKLFWRLDGLRLPYKLRIINCFSSLLFLSSTQTINNVKGNEKAFFINNKVLWTKSRLICSNDVEFAASLPHVWVQSCS